MASNIYISLLRGINVSGKNRVPMQDLRVIYQTHGGEDVSTYIQSGNVVFRSAKSPVVLAKGVSQSIQQNFGCDIPILVRPLAFFRGILTENPFPA